MSVRANNVSYKMLDYKVYMYIIILKTKNIGFDVLRGHPINSHCKAIPVWKDLGINRTKEASIPGFTML